MKVGDSVLISGRDEWFNEQYMGKYEGTVGTIVDSGTFKYQAIPVCRVKFPDGKAFGYMETSLTLVGPSHPAPQEKKTEANDFPHICPRCGAAAYVGLIVVDCKNKCH